MSKLFTEFSVQPFPKIPAKNSNILWLSLGCDNTLPQLMRLPGEPWADPHAQRPQLSTDTSGPVPCARWPRWLLRDGSGQWPWGPPGAWQVSLPALNSDRARPLFCFASCPCRRCPKVMASKRPLLGQVQLKATFQTQEGEEEGTLAGSSRPCFL